MNSYFLKLVTHPPIKTSCNTVKVMLFRYFYFCVVYHNILCYHKMISLCLLYIGKKNWVFKNWSVRVLEAEINLHVSGSACMKEFDILRIKYNGLLMNKHRSSVYYSSKGEKVLLSSIHDKCLMQTYWNDILCESKSEILLCLSPDAKVVQVVHE